MGVNADRDTDKDWRLLGAQNPYWAVISQPEYQREQLNDDVIAQFYADGRAQTADMVRMLEAATGARPGGRVLDFGCGVGRLTEALCDHADAVVGYDISPGMLEMARAQSGRPTYVNVLPDGPFDWIHSVIVFQHIPPERGLALLDELLARLAPGGHFSVQFTLWREPRHMPPEPSRAVHLARRGWRALLGRSPPPAAQASQRPEGTIMMYDYDANELLKRLQSAGMSKLTLFHTDHDGHHGAVILGRRGPA